MPRILSYNVHSCLGMDGSLSPQRIARVIAPCQPDIVCLQELDVGRVRTHGVDQAHAIARELGMHVLFHAAMRVMEEEYGNAVLTIQPAKLVSGETSWTVAPVCFGAARRTLTANYCRGLRDVAECVCSGCFAVVDRRGSWREKHRAGRPR